jgi:hypothetical protein
MSTSSLDVKHRWNERKAAIATVDDVLEHKAPVWVEGGSKKLELGDPPGRIFGDEWLDQLAQLDFHSLVACACRWRYWWG